MVSGSQAGGNVTKIAGCVKFLNLTGNFKVVTSNQGLR